MQPSLLNLDALRRTLPSEEGNALGGDNALPRPGRAILPPSGSPDNTFSLPFAEPREPSPRTLARLAVSRRQLLGLAGVAALDWSLEHAPAMASARLITGASPRGAWELRGDEERVAFCLHGREQWVIEPARFDAAGSRPPHLTIERTPEGVRLALRDARWPGTRLPADFEAFARSGPEGELQLHFALGDFKAQVPCAAWLAGRASATGPLTLDARALSWPGGELRVAGSEATFSPDWTLRLTGPNAALLRTKPSRTLSTVTADTLDIALPPADQPPLLHASSPRRSRLTLHRDGKVWPVAAWLPKMDEGCQRIIGEPFDTLTLECARGIGRGAAPDVVLLAQASRDNQSALLSYQPYEGNDFRLPLHQPCLALTWAREGVHSVLLARFGRSAWFHADGCSLRIGDAPHAPPFEVSAFRGQARSLRCEPAIHEFAASLAGVLTRVEASQRGEPACARFNRHFGSQLVLPPHLSGFATANDAPMDDSETIDAAHHTKRGLILAADPIIRRPILRLPAVATPAPTATPTTAPANGGRTPVRRIPPPILVPAATPVPTRAPILITPGGGNLPIERVPTPAPTAPPLATVGIKPGGVFVQLQNFTVTVVRPRDFLHLRFEFVNLSLQGGELRRNKANETAYVVVHFPQQSIAELAWVETADGKLPNMAAPPFKSQMSGESRLAFSIPSSIGSIPYTLDSLLDWSKWQPSLVPNAQRPQLPLTLVNPYLFHNTVPPSVYLLPSDGSGGSSGDGSGGGGSSAQPTPQPTPKKKKKKRNAFEFEAAPHLRAAAFESDRDFAVTGATLLWTPPGAMTRQPATSDANASIAESIAPSTAPHRASPLARLVQLDNGALKLPGGRSIKIPRLPAGNGGGNNNTRVPVLRATPTPTPAPDTAGSGPPLVIGTVNQGTGGSTPIYHLISMPGAPREPNANETAIELPYRLVLSPDADGGWSHEKKLPSTDEAPTELWHTRLAARKSDGTIDDSTAAMRSLRAIWSPDAVPVATNRMQTIYTKPPMTAQDRGDLVALSGDFTLPGTAKRYIGADFLALSALGGWLMCDTRGAWDDVEIDRSKYGLLEWRHRATMGRDHYVRIVRDGYLFPWGHRASQVTISERVFGKLPNNGDRVAYLRFRTFLVVREPDKTYRDTGWKDTSGAKADNLMPFTSARIVTRTTPDLDPNAMFSGYLAPKVKSTGAEFRFHMMAWDTTGKKSEFFAPMLFIPSSPSGSEPGVPAATGAFEAGGMTALVTAWNSSISPGGTPRYSIETGGQTIALAQPAPGGDTAFSTSTIGISALVPAPAPDKNTLMKARQPIFTPVLRHAEANIPAVQTLLNQTAPITVRFADVYGQAGFGTGNTGEALLQLVKSAADLNPTDLALRFAADKAGGLVKPDFNITGLSRKLGPFGGDIKNIAQEVFDPQEFFKGALDSAKLLGGISLADMLDVAKGLGLADAPKMLTKRIADATAQATALKDEVENAIPQTVETTLHWETGKLKDVLLFKPDDDARLTIDSKVIVKVPKSGKPEAPQVNITGKLTNFKLDFFGFVIVSFNGLSFIANPGSKVDVDADLDKDNPVTFGGPLAFVQTLASIIPADKFNDPPSLDVTPTGVSVGYSLALPDIAAGAWALSNMKIAAALMIPFTGEPVRLTFSFAEQHDPLSIAVYGITGGAFFSVALGLDGLEKLSASIEVGGSIKFSVAVASGGIYIMLGAHFELGAKSEDVELAGYLRAGGAVEVLGLISASIELYMELSYHLANNVVRGEASVKVEISIAFFSKSVSFSVSKEFEAPAVVKNVVGAIAELPAPDGIHLTDYEIDTREQGRAAWWAQYCAAFEAPMDEKAATRTASLV